MTLPHAPRAERSVQPACKYTMSSQDPFGLRLFSTETDLIMYFGPTGIFPLSGRVSNGASLWPSVTAFKTRTVGPEAVGLFGAV